MATIDMPVESIKRRHTGIWERRVTVVSRAIIAMSMKRSVTTLPARVLKSTPSYFFTTAHRSTSPLRGMANELPYERKMLFISVPSLTLYPKGWSTRRHLMARNTCAVMPKGMLANIHIMHRVEEAALIISAQSMPRYIHHMIAAAMTKGRPTLNVLLTTLNILVICVLSKKDYFSEYYFLFFALFCLPL